MHAYNGVFTIFGLGLACFFVFFGFCVSVQVKITVPLLCVCVHFTWKGRPWNDLYCVRWDVKFYSLTHSEISHVRVELYSQFCLKFRCLGNKGW